MLRNSRTLILAVGSLALLLLSVACQNRAEVSNEGQGTATEQHEGEEFTLSGYLLPSDHLGNSLKSKQEEDELNNITSLRILVFDGHYRFQYSADAILMREPIDVSGYSDGQFLPDQHRGEVTVAYSYKVKLKSSSERRILHFVTDADWGAIGNDQMLEGSSAGAILPRLTTTDKKPMWCEIRVDKLDEQVLADKVVKMVRNYAVVKINFQAQASGFTPTGYFLYNTPDKSSVVPYTIDPNTLEISFPTPFTEMKHPTVPANLKLLSGDMQFKSITERSELFEADNDNLYRDKTFIILRGHYNTDPQGTERYYKLDFVSKLSDHNPTANYIAIMRNHEYTFVIHEVTSNGYSTVEEAIDGVANNNLLMSVNTRYISAFKYGDYELSITPIAWLMTVAGTSKKFDLRVSGNAEIIEVKPSWNGTDEYLAPLEIGQNNSSFTVTEKKMPLSHLRTYYVDVLAKTMPATGEPELFSRRAYIYLHEPYKITTRLERDGDKPFGTTYRGNYRYIIELNEQLPEGIYPVHLTIKTKNLTYYNPVGFSSGNPDEELLPLYINIDRETGTQSYRGTLTDKNSKKKRLIAIFNSNTVGAPGTPHDVSVELSSPIHEPITVQLP